MVEQTPSTSQPLDGRAEGRPTDEVEPRVSGAERQTAETPAVQVEYSSRAPRAETGITRPIELRATEADKADSQDAARTAAEMRDGAASSSIAERRARSPTVLMVTVGAEQAQEIEHGLRQAGVEAAVATNNTDAWALFNAANPDVVLLDNDLPGEAGMTLLRAITARRRAADKMPIIIALMDAGSAPLPGVDQSLTKPVTPDRIGRLVIEALSSRSR